MEGKAVEAPVVTQAVEEKPAKTKPVEEKSVEAPVEVKPEENFLVSFKGLEFILIVLQILIFLECET